MIDSKAPGTAIKKVPKTEVLVGEIDSRMSDLMLAAKQAERFSRESPGTHPCLNDRSDALLALHA